ncbi:hypothetical protein D9M68_1007550 [compost metagenome]
MLPCEDRWVSQARETPPDPSYDPAARIPGMKKPALGGLLRKGRINYLILASL